MTFHRPYVKPARVYPAAIPLAQRRNAVFSRMDVPAAPQEKEHVVEHEGYRRLVASMDCISCGKVGRSQHAHTNFLKAKGRKNDDRDAMPLCADEPGQEGCHTKFDQYRLFEGRELHIWWGMKWAALTRIDIVNRGLWPANLPKWSEHVRDEEKPREAT